MEYSSPNLEQFADFDFPNANEKVKQENRANIINYFNQFKLDYIKYFNNREKRNQIELQSELNTKQFNDERKNISVLIIIGSHFTVPSEPLYNGRYQNDAEDLSSALFIRHIFHNAFGVPYSQILITSTDNKDFKTQDKNAELISDQTNFYYKNPDKMPSSKYYFELTQEEEFSFFQDINITQIGNNQFKFFLSEKIETIIKPFNISIIQNEYKNFTNDESNLFVFFLDHRYPVKSNRFYYQFFIERLLEIKCKRFIVCNDSSYSGSMIKHIEICSRFKNIFPHIENIVVESLIYNFLTNLTKDGCKNIMQEIEKNLQFFNFGDISQKYKDDAIQKLKNIDEQLLNKILQFVNDLEDEFINTKCIPEHFINFAKKSIIFTSSSYNQPSISLPGREFNISIKQNPRIRVFGSIFTSIFIESLLNADVQKSLLDFHINIYHLFCEYKKNFEKYIIDQNSLIQGNENDDSLLTLTEIESFFNYNLDDNSRFLNFLKQNDWPNLSSIILDKKYWNVDISIVNEEEYKNVRFNLFKVTSNEIQIDNPNQFGPSKLKSNCEKFKIDFEKAVNDSLDKFNPKEQFSVFDTNSSKEFANQKCNGYAMFIGNIRPIKPNYSRVIMSLKTSISNFFYINQDTVDRDVNCFIEVFKTISPFWDDYDI